MQQNIHQVHLLITGNDPLYIFKIQNKIYMHHSVHTGSVTANTQVILWSISYETYSQRVYIYYENAYSNTMAQQFKLLTYSNKLS